jgi:hypothetical protein
VTAFNDAVLIASLNVALTVVLKLTPAALFIGLVEITIGQTPVIPACSSIFYNCLYLLLKICWQAAIYYEVTYISRLKQNGFFAQQRKCLFS